MDGQAKNIREIVFDTETTGFHANGDDRITEIEFLEFIGDSILIAHNAQFDMGFINAELKRSGRPALPASRFKDTLAMAHAKFPGSPAALASTQNLLLPKMKTAFRPLNKDQHRWMSRQARLKFRRTANLLAR